ncbi:MAG: sulfotransferase domain-containing protein [Deltaproteobacteria bacterium]|nr:sulfotransferase domain-containing protein [Deltaproteobacteria bacterium]
MNDQDLALGVFPSGPTAFDDWLNGVRDTGTWDLQTLDSLTHFFKTYWRYRHMPNVHVYHYSDMKRDLDGAIASMATALGVELDHKLLSEMSQAAGFDNMKRNAEQFAPESGSGMWKAESSFFASGADQQWRDKLSDANLAAFGPRLAELLRPDEADWLVNGSG